MLHTKEGDLDEQRFKRHTNYIDGKIYLMIPLRGIDEHAGYDTPLFELAEVGSIGTISPRTSSRISKSP